MRRTDRMSLTTSLAALALAGCGEPSTGVEANAAAETDMTGSTAVDTPPPARPAAPAAPASETARGVPLPLAGPDASALFHAAYRRTESGWEPLLYLCDGVDGDRIKLVTSPTAHGLSKLWTYAKPGFRASSETVRLGDADPGAGQINRALRRPDGGEFGSVHAINPGVLGDAAATTLPTLSGVTDKSAVTRCRWRPRGRILLVDSRRTVLVTADPDGGYTYQSFDHARPGEVIDAGGGATSVATTTAPGGRLLPADPGRELYEFRAGPWTYRVAASADDRAPGASVTVLRDGQPVQTSVAAAYEMAARRIER